MGNITHASILVPYHGWRISHRTHHANHGHVENDESWYPVTESVYKDLVRCRFSLCSMQAVQAVPRATQAARSIRRPCELEVQAWLQVPG